MGAMAREAEICSRARSSLVNRGLVRDRRREEAEALDPDKIEAGGLEAGGEGSPLIGADVAVVGRGHVG